MLGRLRKQLLTISDGFVIIVLIGLFVGTVAVSLAARFSWMVLPSDWQNWLDGFFQNFGTEMFGAFLTFVLIEKLLGDRRRMEEARERIRETQTVLDQQYRHELVSQLASRIEGSPADAIRLLKDHDDQHPDDEPWWQDWMVVEAIASGGNLGLVYLSEVLLENADLQEGRLQGADLTFSNLRGSDLSAANLVNANIGFAYLESATMVGTHLMGATLNYAHLEGADIGDANLTRADLRSTHLEGAILTFANLAEANLNRAQMNRADLHHAELRDTTLEWAQMSGANLAETSLSGAILRQAQLNDANLRRCDLGGADLRGASLWGARNLTVSQMRQAATWQGAELPDGTLLPDQQDWRTPFEAWVRIVPTDENGYILPAPLYEDGGEE